MSKIHTVYIRNLNEKLSITSLKNQLEQLFENSGYKVENIQAHKNIKLKGQAFVSFDKNVNIYQIIAKFNTKMLCGKPMNVKVANSESDIIVKNSKNLKDYNKYLESERQKRLSKREKVKQNKKRKLEDNDYGNDNDGKQIETDKRVNKKSKHNPEIPNHILIITGLPKDINQEDLTNIFTKFNGFLTINIVQIRQVALIEFQNESNAIECYEELGNEVIVKEKKCTLAYAKK